MGARSSNLEDIRVYQKAMELGEMVWEVVAPWDYFQKNTVGKQWIRSTDSIAANISEGFGRYYYKENRLFCYYGRGSLMESRTWLVKARNRKLLSDAQFQKIWEELEFERGALNRYINSIGRH